MNSPGKPKPQRIVETDVHRKVRARGRCELRGIGECWGELDEHHKRYKSAGGDDTEENLILLCRHHHNLVHMKKISLETMEARQRWWQRFDKPLR